MNNSSMPPKIVRKALLDRCRETDVQPSSERQPTASLRNMASQFGPAVLARHASSLPVLAAFQEFIEAERERARRRMVVLTAFFALLVIGLVAAGLIGGMLLFGKARQDFSVLQGDILAMRRETAATVVTARDTLARFAQDTQKIQADLGRGQDQLGALRQQLQAEKTDRGANVDQLRSTIDGLAGDNAALRKNLDGFLAGWPAVSNALDSAVRQIAQLRRPLPLPVPMSAEPGSLVLSIVPHGATHAVDWRLPIPE
jgi:hypothetical protein